MCVWRAAAFGLSGLLCSIILASCGGGGGGSATNPASVTVTVQPTAITVGQTATVTWSSTAGTTCTASGAWSGSQAASGSATVTPTVAGSDVYTLTCSSSAYASNHASATLTVSAATGFSITGLVSDTAAGGGAHVDSSLVNPWGLSIPAGAPAWVANNGTQTSTLYDGNGIAQPHSAPLVVGFPADGSGNAFNPSGIVANASNTDFIVAKGAAAGPAKFVFDGEGGMLAGWSPAVDPGHAVTLYADAGGAVYKGLALAHNGGAALLYATDFHNAKIDVFDAHFVKQTASPTAFTFVDPAIPAGYAPFGIQALANGAGGAEQIYVTYAEQAAPDNHDNTNGAGLGFVDIYDTNGQLVKRLVSQGALNAPWGLALAPADFGTLSNALLVGNFGDGKINGYDAATGAFIGIVGDATGAPIAAPGLWGIAFGNDVANQPHNTLFLAAGTNNEANGLYARIDAGGSPVLNAPPVVALSVPAGTLSGNVSLTASVQGALQIAKVDFFANSTLIGTATAAPFTVAWNTTTTADGQVNVLATATDANGNTGSSPASTVTVANAAPAAVTLTQLQTQIFTPICSVCHTGAGSGLPGVQNLTAGNTFANIVGVASIEQPSLKRIQPNDPADSYLIQKIQGSAGISGSRMPLGCGSTSNPCLDQATIDLVKTWVSQGALNN